MRKKYDKCPICDTPMNASSNGGGSVTYNCNNEKEIIFSKARGQDGPEYHSFSYRAIFMPGRTAQSNTTEWTLQFNLTPKKVVRIMQRDGSSHTDITDRYGQHIMRVDALLEPDFPLLEKLRNKIKTCLNFS